MIANELLAATVILLYLAVTCIGIPMLVIRAEFRKGDQTDES